jgi:hypothetical protein
VAKLSFAKGTRTLGRRLGSVRGDRDVAGRADRGGVSGAARNRGQSRAAPAREDNEARVDQMALAILTTIRALASPCFCGIRTSDRRMSSRRTPRRRLRSQPIEIPVANTWLSLDPSGRVVVSLLPKTSLRPAASRSGSERRRAPEGPARDGFVRWPESRRTGPGRGNRPCRRRSRGVPYSVFPFLTMASAISTALPVSCICPPVDSI